MSEQTKSFLTSTTIWGILIGLISQIATRAGIHFPADQAGLTNDIVGLIGTALAIYGRFTASQPLHITTPSTGSPQGGFATIRILIASMVGAIAFGCAVAPQTPAQAVYATQGAYASALTIAVAYKQLPDCARPPTPKLCSDRATVVKLQEADDKAYAALQAAQTLVRNPNAGFNLQTAIAAANAAVGLLTQITTTLPVK